MIPLPKLVLTRSFLFAPVVLACGCGGEEPERPTNVVLVVIDTLRRDHLSCYGYERATSPRIDELARDSVLYASAISHAPWTTPSIGSLLTSQYPTSLGIKNDRSVLPQESVLLSEVLTERGYLCGAVVSHSFCSSKWGFDQGCEVFDESNILGHGDLTSQGVTDRALQFLEDYSDQPFFLWLHYFDPHFAYNGHDEHDFREPGSTYEGPVGDGMPFSQLVKLRETMTPEDVQEVIDLYDSEIAYTDAQIGRVLDDLRSRGLYEDSLIIFTADHGEEFMDHGRLGHAKSLYEELIGVPLIVKYPGSEGGRVEARVGLVDVYPSVLATLDVAPRSELQGKPLPRSDAEEDPSPFEFAETGRGIKVQGVVSQRYKFIQRRNKGMSELYDLEADPEEKENLYGRLNPEPEEVVRMREALDEWAVRVEALRVEESAIELSKDEVERLEALGYSGDE